MRKKQPKKKQRKGTCSKCGGVMDIYYGEWCPKCDKPQVFTIDVLNLIRCERYLRAQGREELADELREWMQGEAPGNDSYMLLTFEEGESLNEGIWEVFELGDRDSVMFEISW